MTDDKQKDFQDELDVYQAAWVLGKQRGEKNPLTKEQLVMLVESGRIDVNWLNEEEKEMVGKSVNVIDDVKFKSKERLERSVSVTVAHVLLDIRRKMISDVGVDVWNEMSEEAQKETVYLAFGMMYGMNPEVFAAELFDLLSDIGAR